MEYLKIDKTSEVIIKRAEFQSIRTKFKQNIINKMPYQNKIEWKNQKVAWDESASNIARVDLNNEVSTLSYHCVEIKMFETEQAN